MKSLIIGILIICCACSNPSKHGNRTIQLSDTEIISIASDSPHLIRVDKAQTITTSEVFDMIESIDYIKLDSSVPIGQIDEMILTNDKILVLDSFVSQELFVFEKTTGKLLFRIKNKGRGPNEYLSIRDMQIDTVRNEILVNDALALSYLYFSAENGDFIRREKGIPNCYVKSMDNTYINLQVNGQDYNEEESWAILVTDKDSILHKGFEFNPIQMDNYIVNSFTYDNDGGLLYTPVYSDTVYQFKSPSSAFAKYVIQQDKSIWTLNDQWLSPQEVDKRIKENNYTQYRGHFLATKNHAAFTIGHKWNENITSRPYFWDKRTDVVYAWDTTLKPKETRPLWEIIQKPIAVYGNTFYSTFSPAIPEEYRKDLNPKLKKMLDDSDDGDNPIVVCYKLK